MLAARSATGGRPRQECDSGKMITGQNPASAKLLAQEILKTLQACNALRLNVVNLCEGVSKNLKEMCNTVVEHALFKN